MSNRVQRTVGTDVTRYLLDLQPGLPVVLSETLGLNTTRYLHTPRGIHAQKDASGSWEWMAQDGLGSVRGVMSNALDVLWTGSPAPYGTYFNEVGTRQSPYLFIGEYTDPITGFVHLRARDYSPDLAVFPSLDPLETRNRYAYVNGNPVNFVDRTGLQAETAIATCLASPVCRELLIAGVGIAAALAAGLWIANQAGVDIDLPDISLPNVSAPDLSFLLDALLSSPEMDPVLQAQYVTAACSGIPPGMPGSCNNGPMATPTPGAGDMTDAERLALANACNGSLCAGDIPVVTEIVVPTIRWIGTVTAQPWQDHRNFQPGPTPSQYPVPGLTPNPTQTATATRTPDSCDSTIYRVQGGTGRRSRELIGMTPSRDIMVRTDIMEQENLNWLWVTFDNPNRALNYLLTNRPGGYVIYFRINSSYVASVRQAARFEEEKPNYVAQFGLEAWRNIPIIGDPTKSYIEEADNRRTYTSFGLPRSWIPNMIAAVCPGTGDILRDD
jgi:RHS repeat-associated protein